MTPCWINFTIFLKGDGECRCRYGICCCFVTTERKKSFLSHMVPSVTDDQTRNLLSNPLFHQKDLFAPTTIEATLQAAGNVVHLGDGPTVPLRVRLGILLARGGILLPARRVCSRTIRLPMNDSLLLLLVLLCLGDDHTLLHLTSLPQIRPAAHFTKGGDSPPIRRLGYQSSFRLMMSANPLRFSYYRTKGRVT